MSASQDSRDDEATVARALRKGLAPTCPRCGGDLARRDVRPREDVPYVRDRIWFTCGACSWSGVVERRRTLP